MNGYTSKISPSQVSENVLGFVRDYTGATAIKFSAIPLIKPYLTVTQAAYLAAHANAGYVIDTLTLQGSNVSPLFGNSRSMSFVYRPEFSTDDYYVPGVVTNPLRFLSSVIVFNQRTGQTIHIKPNRLNIENAAIAGPASNSYIPRSITIQGSVPFYFDLNDIVEICSYSPDATFGSGKLTLNFFNFDTTSWYETNVDQLQILTVL